MTRTKLDTPAFADQSVDTRNIADGTIQNQDISGSLTNDKLANSSFTINGSSLSLGGSTSIIAFLEWQAVTVADGSTTLTAEAGKGYFLDTNTGVIEVFLPTSPSRGDTIALVDYSGTFATNKLIINTGGQLIDSTTGSEFKVETNNSIVELVYVDANKGWQVILNQAAGTTPSSVLTDGVYDTDPQFISATGGTITTSGDYKIHTFTGDGNFVVSNAGEGNSSFPSIVDYLVVAGGGGAGAIAAGGAGGFRESLAAASPTHTASPHTASPLKATTGITVTATTYPITVGGGGAGAGFGTDTSNGSNSVFSTITSAGGGGIDAICSSPFGAGGFRIHQGKAGGSGGGVGVYLNTVPTRSGGSGNTPPVSPSQGNPGGSGPGPIPSGGTGGGSGGGGATAAGTNTGGPYVGAGKAGGAGATTSISGSPTSYAGGGGGGGRNDDQPGCGQQPGGAGGTGGGGAGGPSRPTAAGSAGSDNTGGGGGGGGSQDGDVKTGGSGGKGIVIIRYKYQ